MSELPQLIEQLQKLRADYPINTPAGRGLLALIDVAKEAQRREGRAVIAMVTAVINAILTIDPHDRPTHLIVVGRIINEALERIGR